MSFTQGKCLDMLPFPHTNALLCIKQPLIHIVLSDLRKEIPYDVIALPISWMHQRLKIQASFYLEISLQQMELVSKYVEMNNIGANFSVHMIFSVALNHNFLLEFLTTLSTE